MPLERKKGASLCELLAGRSKGSTSKDALSSQVPPPLSPPPPLASPFTPANLRKRKKDKEVKEGELVLSTKGVPLKVLKKAKGKQRASSTEGKEAKHMVEVRPLNPTWTLQLELDEAAVPWNSLKEFQRGNAQHIANTLEQPLLLPKDMATLKNLKQQDLFLPLKRDLALVILSTLLANFMLGYFLLI